MGRPSSPRAVADGLGRASSACPASPARSARRRSRTSAPTARRSPRRSRSVRVLDRETGAVARADAPAECGFGYRTRACSRARRPLRRARGDASRCTATRAVAARCATPSWRGRSASSRRAGAPLAEVREAVLAPAPRQGHGARPGRPRHGQRRLVLHQPDPRPGRVGRARAGWRGAPDPRSRSPTAGVKTSAAWLIERAGFRKGYGDRRGRDLHQAHARAGQPRRRRRRPSCSRWPARSRRACASASASSCGPSRRSSGSAW